MKHAAIFLAIMFVIMLLLLPACKSGETGKSGGGTAPAEAPQTGNGAKIGEEEAMELLSAALVGCMTEGSAIVYVGEDEVNGQYCRLFSFGENSPEKFTALEHYAVTGNGEMYRLNILSDEYELFEEKRR